MGPSVRLMLVIVGLLVTDLRSSASTNFTEANLIALTPDEREWINLHPVLRVGVVTDLAPFSYVRPDGSLSGIDMDFMNLISQRTGLKFELIRQESWEALATNWDQLDMVCSVLQSTLREQVADFTRAYTTVPYVIVEREGEETFGFGGVLRGRKVALPRRYLIAQKLAEEMPSAKVTLVASQEECFEMVANEKADATIANLLIASQYLNTHPKVKLSISGVVPEPNLPLRFAVRQGLPVGILDKGLASISREEMDAIFTKHLLFGLESRERVGLIQKRARQILIAAGIVGLLLVFWNVFIRKEIHARRKAEAELREAHESAQVFAHSLSHDLRGPLRAIVAFAGLMKVDQSEKLDSDGRDHLDRIITAGSHMDKMITDVLVYSRTSNSEWPMERVELDPLVQQLIETFPPEQRECFQIVSPLRAVKGNATLLNQCLENLLSNAVRFVPVGRTPEVKIRGQEEDSKVIVSVEDNGIGVDQKDQQRIFQIFERAAPSGYTGTGIGLAVVAKAVERMGGSAGVKSEVGRGSRFWIRLPRASR